LRIKQQRDVALWTRHVDSLRMFLGSGKHEDECERLGIPFRLEHAQKELARLQSAAYLKSLVGTIGADPIHSTAGKATSSPDEAALAAAE
jgi:hypothetical protein